MHWCQGVCVDIQKNIYWCQKEDTLENMEWRRSITFFFGERHWENISACVLVLLQGWRRSGGGSTSGKIRHARFGRIMKTPPIWGQLTIWNVIDQKKLKLLTSRGLEVVLFQVLHPDEWHLPFEGDTVFESLEDDPMVGLDPLDIREEYQKTIQDQIDRLKNTSNGLGIDYILMDTSTPLQQALSYYLLKRKSLMLN